VRGLTRYVPIMALAAALAGCASGTGPVKAAAPTSHAPTASASGSALASPTAGAAPLLGALPVPAGATPWTQNTNGLLSRDPFVQAFYVKSGWSQEEGDFARLGFISGVYEGWINADGSQQVIAIMRFPSAHNALSEFDALTGTLRDHATSSQVVTDPADGGLGTVNPTLDSMGNAKAELVTHTGDYVIDVHELTVGTPDPADAKALLLKQYQSFTSIQGDGA
jgi:hypothetical protein